MKNKFIALNFEKDASVFYGLLTQLRPHLSFEDFKEIYFEANKADGYQLIGLEDNHELVGTIGFRILHDFVHGKHLYIDDLVTSESHRSKGYGAILLEYAEKVAKDHGCRNLRLCTGIENERGKIFYERNAWNLRAVVFKKKL